MARKPQKHRRSFDRKNTFTLIALGIVLVLAVIAFTPLSTKITQGLDVQGGLSVIMNASHADGTAVTDDDMDSAVNIVQQRVNSLGASETTVQRQGASSILVQIPGVSNSENALATLGSTGNLEFVDLNDITDSNEVAEIKAGGTSTSSTSTDTSADVTGTLSPNTSSDNGMGVTLAAGTYTAFMTGDSINTVTVNQSQTGSEYMVDLQLDSDGTSAFAQKSSELVADHGQIAIVLDGVVQSAPAVQSEIPNGQVEISGNYTYDEAKALKAVLESGSLPVTLTISTSETVGPTLGQASLRAGIIAALFGFVFVALYLLFYYRGLGVLTVANLCVFAVVYLGILAVLSYFGLFALSLAGMAGIVLTIGMAADSSILVLERFKEEIRMGRSIKAASITGVRHAIGTSVDADLVTLVSALALFFIALGSVKGFGLTLALGIAVDIITMLTFKAPIIRLLAPRQMAKHPGFWGITDDMSEGVAAEAAALEKGAENA